MQEQKFPKIYHGNHQGLYLKINFTDLYHLSAWTVTMSCLGWDLNPYDIPYSRECFYKLELPRQFGWLCSNYPYKQVNASQPSELNICKVRDSEAPEKPRVTTLVSQTSLFSRIRSCACGKWAEEMRGKTVWGLPPGFLNVMTQTHKPQECNQPVKRGV